MGLSQQRYPAHTFSPSTTNCSCHGTSVGNAFDVNTAEECLDVCIDTDGYVWATHFAGNKFCELTLNCPDVEVCEDCAISSVNNDNCDLDDGIVATGGDFKSAMKIYA